MVDQGFNAEEIMGKSIFKMNMMMLEDEQLKEDLGDDPVAPIQC